MEQTERLQKAIEFNKSYKAFKIASRLTVSPLIVAGDVDQRDIADLKGLYADWAVGVAYGVGDLCVYEGVLYAVIQAHTSQSDWTPVAAASLFKRHHSYGDAWRQPQGAHDVYKTDDVVTYNEALWKSTIDNNSWAPGVHGWVEV